MTDKATDTPQAEPAVGAQPEPGVRPAVWAAMTGSGNIRIWTAAPDQVARLSAQVGQALEPLYDGAELFRVAARAAEVERTRLGLLVQAVRDANAADKLDTFRPPTHAQEQAWRALLDAVSGPNVRGNLDPTA